MTLSRRGEAPTAAAAGALSGALGLQPTGSAGVDAVLVGLAAALCAWAAARAPWWLLAGAGGLAAAFASGPLGLAAAALAVVAAARLGIVGEQVAASAWSGGVAAAAVVVALCRLGLPGPFGVESIVGITAGFTLAAVGLARRGRRVVRRATILAGVAAGAATLASLAVAVSAGSARDDITIGEREVRRGLSALSDGDVEAAQAHLNRAADVLEASRQRLDRFWNTPARAVPVVAQHHRAAATLVSRVAEANERLRGSLNAVDAETLRRADGAVDLVALERVGSEVSELQRVLDELATAVDEVNSPWLVSPVRTRLDELTAELADYRHRGERAEQAFSVLPMMLGGEQPKVYFVAFVTPAEARGSVGLMGNWAELTIDEGRMSMTAFGRHTDLRDAGDPTTWRIEGMPEFIARYGSVGFASGPDGTAERDVWPIVTMSPHFPSTAEVIAQLYPRSGGQPIDGVIALDPAVIAALLEFTGPIDVAGLPISLTHRNAEQYLVHDQYVDFDDALAERIDALEVLGKEAFERLVGSEQVDPIDLGRRLAPLARERHLAVWMADPTAQAVVADLGIDHALPPTDGRDGVVLAFNNGTGNKIEGFLDTEIVYDRRLDRASAGVVGHLTVTLTNRAPASGLPDYLIGNPLGLPTGSSRLVVSAYTTGPAERVLLDGQPVEFGAGLEQGWTTADVEVLIPPGATRILEVGFVTPVEPFQEPGEPLLVVPNLPEAPAVTVRTELPDPAPGPRP